MGVGAALGAAPAVAAVGYNAAAAGLNIAAAAAQGITDGVGIGAAYMQQLNYGFVSQAQGSGYPPMYGSIMDADDLVDTQQMAMQQTPWLNPRYGQMPSSSSSQFPIYVQRGMFDQQASRALTQGVPPPPRSTASSSGYPALLPPQQALSPQSASPGSDLADALGGIMDAHALQQQALVAAPPPPRRRNVITTMRDIFDPAAETSPDEQLRRRIDAKTTAVWNNPQELADMINDMRVQLSKQASRTLQAGAALTAIRNRFKPLDVDPKDKDNENLVITYYVIKNLVSQCNIPATQNLMSWT
jgi:hypothetical protein